MADDYYSLLGVSRTATADEIKKAFRAKAHQFHPDKSNGDAERFKQVNEAYQVLSDPQKRQQYDQFGTTFDHARRQGHAGPGGNPFGGFGASGFSGNADFSDLGDIFGDMFGFGNARRQARPRRGRDIAAAVHVSLRTAVFGGEERIDIRRPAACQACGGSGAEPGTSPTACGTCGGSGQVRRVQQTILGAMQSVGECPTCQGQGTVVASPCKKCHGQGRVQAHETLTVKIPAGIDDGQRIKLSGKGEAGPRGVPAGDLYLEVAVTADPVFTRREDDLLCRISVPLTTAALGGTVMVEALDGPLHLKIPAGTPNGRTFAIKGKGVTKLRSRGRGDLLATVDVLIPQKLSARAKKLMKDLQDEGV